MSIERHGEERWLSCDECGDDQDGQYHNDDFQRMIDAARAAGWLIVKVKGKRTYEHYCRCCQEGAPPNARTGGPQKPDPLRPAGRSKANAGGWSAGLARKQFG